MTETKRLPLLIEIGTDELPARFLPVERKFLAPALEGLFQELKLDHDEIRVMASPRRLAVMIDALETCQQDVVMEVKGPPMRVAYDADGNPTRAAEGFARKNGLELADAYEITDEKGGTFLAAKVQVPGRETSALLVERLPQILLDIPFQKTMHWGTSDLEYARPVQWLVAMLGDDLIPLEFAGVNAGRMSRGHRTLADNRGVEIAAPADYLSCLRDAFVVVDQEERKKTVVAGVQEILADMKDAVWLMDEDLLSEVVDLCEFPTPFSGGFDKAFFELPPEVIVTALKAHQRYFAVGVAGGEGLLPVFISVRDGGSEALDNVRGGNEKVLRARLSDALFYWHFDQKHTPDQHVDRLVDVTWIEGFGSVLDKTDRVVALCEYLWNNGMGDGGPCPGTLLRAARLYKFDIVTEMVRDGKEFTKLEGIIGARYAALAGESREICETLENFHKPRSSGDDAPKQLHAAILSLADRFDTLSGCWLAGLVPTGAKDPYALRRHTLAILKIVQTHDFRISMATVLEKALSVWTNYDAAKQSVALEELLSFVGVRMEGYLVQSGYSQEAVRAVMAVHRDDPADIRNWASALTGFSSQDDFLLLAKGFKRCRNILADKLVDDYDAESCRRRWLEGGKTPEGQLFDKLFESEEVELRDRVVGAMPQIMAAVDSLNYEEIFRILSDLGPSIDRFFDAVRVNVEDEALRDLRHAFLQEIHGLFAGFADFSHIAPLDMRSD
jgi:glycyl-tRNA synthetase beta chain